MIPWYWWSYIWATSMLGDRADTLSTHPSLTDGGDPALCVSLLLTIIYSPEREDSTSPHRHTEIWVLWGILLSPTLSALAACRLLPVLHRGAAPSALRQAAMPVEWLTTVTNQGWTAAVFTLRSHCFHLLASFMLLFWGLTPFFFQSFFNCLVTVQTRWQSSSS